MKFLFNPLIYLMRNLSYRVLFPAIAVLVIVPFLYVLSLQLSSTKDDITFNAKESAGTGYGMQVQGLLHAVQEHAMYSVASIATSERYAQEINATRTRVEQAMQRVSTAEQTFGPSLPDQNGQLVTRVKLQELFDGWNALQSTSFTTTETCWQAHADLITQINNFVIQDIGSYSNLILDPDLDSYWLMDAFIFRLPSTTELVTRMTSKYLQLTSKPVLEESDRLEMISMIAKTRTFVFDMRANFEMCFSNNKSGTVRPVLAQTIDNAFAPLERWMDQTYAIMQKSEKQGMVGPRVLQEGLVQNEQLHNLYAKVGPPLTALIDARVAAYTHTRQLGLGTGIAAIALLLYILAAFYMHVASLDDAIRGELAVTVQESQSLRERAENENRILQGNIMQFLTTVSEVADGDLTKRATVTEGALGNVADALNQMLDNLVEVLADALISVQETTSATSKITEVSKQVTDGAVRQVEMLRAVDRTVQDMSSRIAEVSENASTAAMAASRTQESALSGADSVNNVVQGMEGLRANVQAGAKKIKNLGDRSMEISGIVATIAKISEQTNMLALNAAIEAARAGEQGRGFSVVADEVRKLAERTATATMEISKLVTSIQAETSESVQAIEEQTRAVEEEAEIVGRAGDALLKIQGESTQSAELIGDISTTAKAQVLIATQAAKSVEQASRIAEAAQTSTLENLRLTQTLDVSSRKLAKSMSRFKLSKS